MADRVANLTESPSDKNSPSAAVSPSPVRVHLKLNQELAFTGNETFEEKNDTSSNSPPLSSSDNNDNVSTTTPAKRNLHRRSATIDLILGGDGFDGRRPSDISMVLGQEDLLSEVMAQLNEQPRENDLTRERMCVCQAKSGILRLWDFFMGIFLIVNFILAVLVTTFNDSIFQTSGVGFTTYSVIRVLAHLIDVAVNSRVAFQVPTKSLVEMSDGSVMLQRDGGLQSRSTWLQWCGQCCKCRSIGHHLDHDKHLGGGQRRRSYQVERKSDQAAGSGVSIITDSWEMLREYRAQGWFASDLLLALLPSELIYVVVFLNPATTSVNAASPPPSVAISVTYFLFTLLLPVLLKCSKLVFQSRTQYNNSITLGKWFQGANEVISALYGVFVLLLMVLIFAHCAGCIFYLIARFEEMYALNSFESEGDFTYEPISWMYDLKMQNSAFIKRYVVSLYWALVTITSTGYGDVVAVTVAERAYNCIVSLLGALCYATIFGRVTVMFNTMAQNTDIFRRRMAQINRFMSVYELPVPMRKRIRQQIKFDWTLTRGIEVDDVIEQLPYSMQVEVRREILQESLEQIPVMQLIPKDAITALCMFFQIRQCIAGSVIIQEGDPATEIYFVKSGTMSVVKDGKKIFRLSNGAIFGEAGLLFSKARTATIVADTRCVYFALTGPAYAKIVAMYPKFHDLLKSRAEIRLRVNKNASPKAGGGAAVPELVAEKGERQEKEGKQEESSDGESGETKTRSKVPEGEEESSKSFPLIVSSEPATLDELVKEMKLIHSKLDEILTERKTERTVEQWRAWRIQGR